MGDVHAGELVAQELVREFFIHQQVHGLAEDRRAAHARLMPQRLQANIEYRQYESGHMVYANLPALKQLHDNVADFIHRTEAPSQKEGPVDAH